jgi:phosphatidylinositol glycan class M
MYPPRQSASPSSRGTSSSPVAAFFSHPTYIYLCATALRLLFLLYGLWQDANSPLKYTDIDYFVFTDAAKFVSRGQSPYHRETYRYTPLLAWLLVPTSWRTGSAFWDAVCFSFGKVLFAVADLVAGWLIVRVLTMRERGSRSSGTADASDTKAGRSGMESAGRGGMDPATARMYASIWLLNPMVAIISTRGSSEGLLGVLVMALLWAVLSRNITVAGVLLGFGVHFKIYPFIYAPTIIWWMDDKRPEVRLVGQTGPLSKLLMPVLAFITPQRTRLALTSITVFLGLNIFMIST